MKKFNTEMTIEEFTKQGKLMHEALTKGDCRKNNTAHKKLMTLYKVFKNNKLLIKECMPVLLESEDSVVKSQAAIQCLSLEVYKEDAVRALEEATEEEKGTIISIYNRSILNTYYKQGYFKWGGKG